MNSHQDAAHIVRETIVKVYPCTPDALSLEHSLLDLGIDSLTLTNIAAELEAACPGELSEGELQRLLESRTVGELIGVAENFLSRIRAAAD